MKDYIATYRDATQALCDGNPRQAFQEFYPVLRYPGHATLRQNWYDAFNLFARIGEAIASKEFALKVQRVASFPEDLQALYDLGYNLIEESLPEIAATVLARANEIAPQDPTILSELVAALESSGYNSVACQVLRQAPKLLEENLMFLYLLAFNALMTGDLAEPKRLLPRLEIHRDSNEGWMAERIDGMLQRADALLGIAPLDSQDLRGWHFVLTGQILLHLSPYGFNDGMNGRYALIQDSESLVLHGIQRLKVVFDVWGIAVERVFVLPDRHSAILAHAVADIYSCPLHDWIPQNSQQPGLVVAYDLRELNSDVLEQLRQHYPGQILWSHATCWTQEQWFAADLTTYLYQYNQTPWEERMFINPDTQELDRSPATEATTEELAAQIVRAIPDEENQLDDLPSLMAIASTARAMTTENARAGAFRQAGQRNRQWLCSPVPSSRFL